MSVRTADSAAPSRSGRAANAETGVTRNAPRCVGAAPNREARLWFLGEKRQRRACRCRSDLDDLVVGDAGLLERIAIQNGVKFGTFHCSGQDEPANARALRSGEQKVAGGIVLAQPDSVSSNMPVDLGQRDFVAKDDGVHDLPPVSRTTVKFVESITMENDGHEDESIQRRADHWVSPAGRGWRFGQGGVPHRRLQRRDVLQVARQVRRHGGIRGHAAA